MSLKLKHQKFAVVSFQEAHPNFIEQAEVCAWATFMREVYHKYSAGKRFKPSDPAEKTGELTVPPKVNETPENKIPSTTVDELIEDYILWRNCNAIKMHKYYKQFYDKMPISRAFKIHGVHRYLEDANHQRDDVNAVEGTDVFVVKLQDEDGNAAPIIYNPPKMLIKDQKFSDTYLDNLMSEYRKNQRDADELNNRIQRISIRKAKEQRELNKEKIDPTQITPSLADQICGVENSVLEEKTDAKNTVSDAKNTVSDAKTTEQLLAKLERESFLEAVEEIKKEN